MVRIGRKPKPSPKTFTGSCRIREHTGDGAYVGPCEHATYNGVCPRHGVVAMYTNLDDRDVAVADRQFPV